MRYLIIAEGKQALWLNAMRCLAPARRAALARQLRASSDLVRAFAIRLRGT
jgi:hypothetical protein